MADNKDGRDKQADDERRRQRKRDIVAELERGDETEPPLEPEALDGLEPELETLTFPATGADVVDAVGDRPLGPATIADFLPETDTETFEDPEAVQLRLQRPTIAGAMKRVIEANATVSNDRLPDSQREAYERTFRELRDIDAVDEDEAIGTVADWAVEQIDEKGKTPGSRAVRRQAAKVCRANGYEVRNDEWLGV
ncbi:DUF5789 family protein [Haloarcula laminariae]|uniref:DUF5789 family protein n=1 Tax=Haloarcula laminariae TaxID=2961577 RepID=UPI002404E93C|nr:hypothetical protein [Halomicroarcula sp. FL173]